MTHIGTIEGETVRPDAAALQFARALLDAGLLDRTWRVRCELAGASGEAARRRAVGTAILLGLEGEASDGIDPPTVARRLRRIHDRSELRLLGTRRIAFDRRHHLVSRAAGGPAAGASAVLLSAFDPGGSLLLEQAYEVTHPADL